MSTGNENSSAKYAATVSVVVNGSPTPIVIGFSWVGGVFGSALAACWSPAAVCA